MDKKNDLLALKYEWQSTRIKFISEDHSQVIMGNKGLTSQTSIEVVHPSWKGGSMARATFLPTNDFVRKKKTQSHEERKLLHMSVPLIHPTWKLWLAMSLRPIHLKWRGLKVRASWHGNPSPTYVAKSQHGGKVPALKIQLLIIKVAS